MAMTRRSLPSRRDGWGQDECGGSGGDRHRRLERHRPVPGTSIGVHGLSRRPDRPPPRRARGRRRRDRRGRWPAVAAVADVGDRAALRAAVAEVEGRLGPADVLVANAGFGRPTRLDPLNIADVEETIRVNVLGVIYSVEAVLPGMLARRAGTCWRSPAWPRSRDCPASRPTAPAKRP